MASRNPNAAEHGKLGGRPKGVPNKSTIQLKEAILQALADVGGIEYLARIATDNPASFIQLLGKLIPLQAAQQPEEGKARPVEYIPLTRLEDAD